MSQSTDLQAIATSAGVGGSGGSITSQESFVANVAVSYSGWSDTTSLSLVPGTYLITLNALLVTSNNTGGRYYFGVSAQSGNSFTDHVYGDNALHVNVPPQNNQSYNWTLPNYKLVVTTTTTYYFKSAYDASQPDVLLNARMVAVKIL